MHALINTIIATLDEGITGPALDDAIRNAAFVFEKWRKIPPAGWSDEVIEAELDEPGISRLKAGLVDFIRRGGHGSWALSKSADPGLKPVYIGVLNRELEEGAGELYQAMIALHQLGEDVFCGRTSLSILDEAENRASAREYLNDTGRPK